MATKPPATVLQFRTTAPPTPEVPIAVARRSAAHPLLAPTTPALDLSGKPRVIFLIGRGGTGKTTVARWLVERANTAHRQVLLAALDPVNRTLANYAENVSQPASSNPTESARWLRDFLGFAMAGKHSAVIDFGGGDTTLSALLEALPDLSGALDNAGMAAVALYTLAPRIDDLGPFLQLGFQPPATAFICNTGLADPSVDSMDRARPFTPLLQQENTRAAIEAGARTIWMPRLDSVIVGEIETHRMSFDRASREMGPFNASSVKYWLGSMDKAFGEIATWLA